MDVLLVSKPLTPPWNDSGKNWARDVARFTSPDVTHRVMVVQGCTTWRDAPRVIPTPIYRTEGRFAPATVQKARAWVHLLRQRSDLVHFCFAPNRRTNRLASAALKIHRRPSVHTILSVPERFDGIRSILFAQRVVCVSKATADRLVREGVRGVEVVPASIPLQAPLSQRAPERVRALSQRLGLDDDEPLVVFPGDYEFSKAADTFAGAVARLWRSSPARFVFACRIKRPASLQREAHFRHMLRDAEAAGRVRFLRDVDDIAALLARATAIALPAESTYAKMDIPLVLLEALEQRTPIVIADVAPLRETLGPDPESTGGCVVPPLDAEALADTLARLIRDAHYRDDLGDLGRAHVEHSHDAATNCQRYASIYASI